MSAGNVHGIVNGSIATNGRAGAVNGHGTRRHVSAKRIPRKAEPAKELAPFLKTESAPEDAPMWPVHPVMWLQPELRLAVPAATGLVIERKHTIPVSGFLENSMTPANHARALDRTAQPVLPSIRTRLPASDLTPLGWDPRVSAHATRKEDHE